MKLTTTCPVCGETFELINPAAAFWAAKSGMVCADCRRKKWYGEEQEEDDPQYAELPY